jgi:hypothetical protein
MTRLAAMCIAAILLVGQANFTPTPSPQAGGMQNMTQEQAPPLKFRLLVVQASQEEGIDAPFVDPEIKWFQDVLPQLPFNTFVQITTGESDVALGEVIRMPVNDIYDVFLAPEGQSPSGELQLKVRISMAAGSGAVDAVRADAQVAPNQVLVFQGLEHTVGELVCIVGLVQDNEDEPQQDEQQEDQQQNEEQQEPQDEQGDQEQQEDEQNQEEQQPEEPKDRQEIEAILDMLEAMDKQELDQNEDERDPMSVRNPWW